MGKLSKQQQAWLRKQQTDFKKSILNIKGPFGSPSWPEILEDRPNALKEAYEFRKNKRVFDPVVHALMKKIGYDN
jgi:hypothetical protein